MKKIIRLFCLAIFVIPILTLSTAEARDREGGSGDKNPNFDKDHYNKADADRVIKREREYAKMIGIDYVPIGGAEGEQDKWKKEDHDFGGNGGNGDQGSHGTGTPAPGVNSPAPVGNSVPLDGGIGILLAAGIGLGIKKMAGRNKA